MPGITDEERNLYIANNPDLSPEEIALINSFSSGLPLRPQQIGDKVYLTEFKGHFIGVPLDNIIDNYASPQEIQRYQNFLQDNNIVPQNYFAESYGQFSEKLRTSVQMIMNWVDANVYAVEGTQLYSELNEQTENSPVFFTKLQQDNNEFSYFRNLFNHGLKELAKKQEILDDVAEAEAAKKMAMDYIPPSDEVLDDLVESLFESQLNRKPTAEELDAWSTRFAQNYSISYAQNRAAAEALDSYNFMTSQPQYAGLTTEQVQELGEAGKGFVDLSQFTTQSPADISEQQFQGAFEDQIDDVTQAKRVRQMQQDMMTYMFGG
jgi:hypothetical protein